MAMTDVLGIVHKTPSREVDTIILGLNVNRKAQDMPQSQTAANPRHPEEEKRTKTYPRKTNKQMYEKHKDQLPLLKARWSEC